MLREKKKKKPFWFNPLDRMVQFDTKIFRRTFGRIILVTSDVSKKKLSKSHDYILSYEKSSKFSPRSDWKLEDIFERSGPKKTLIELNPFMLKDNIVKRIGPNPIFQPS